MGWGRAHLAALGALTSERVSPRAALLHDGWGGVAKQTCSRIFTLPLASHGVLGMFSTLLCLSFPHTMRGLPCRPQRVDLKKGAHVPSFEGLWGHLSPHLGPCFEADILVCTKTDI